MTLSVNYDKAWNNTKQTTSATVCLLTPRLGLEMRACIRLHVYGVVVVVFYCSYAQSINCSEDISVETDECRHISVINIDVETP